MFPEVLQAIADAISARLPDMQVKPYVLANPTPPAAQIVPASAEYDKAMRRGLDTWQFTLTVFVAETADIGAQAKLYRMLEPSGETSIKEAVEADVTLGGLVVDVWLQAFNGFRRYQLEGGGPMIGMEWTVQVQHDPAAAGG